MGTRRFVIPDIHGCERTFSHLLKDVIRLQKTDTLYLLGDTIDRGPRSKGVIDTILNLQAEGYEVHPLRGNHEDMFLKSCRDRSYFHLWMLNGGHTTLASFGVEDGCEIPLPYRSFIESWPYFIELADFILVHAGLNFRIDNPLTDTEAMLWSRDLIIDKRLLGGRKLIGGHTPFNREEIRHSLTRDRILLDNGCVYSGEAGMGSLTALELNAMTLYFQENIDISST
jgi:serine/threonine protein phosphatase 1